ncbi:MAG: hypothetical protein KIT60_12815 [Burkholderiaceae bacterium]|nr:hypothetical protein [Burkholderiaceae bacterium]
MTTLAPRHFIVYRKPDHATRFWMTQNGRGHVGTTTLEELARELSGRHARQLYALPPVDRPAGTADLTSAEAHRLLAWLKIGTGAKRKT